MSLNNCKYVGKKIIIIIFNIYIYKYLKDNSNFYFLKKLKKLCQLWQEKTITFYDLTLQILMIIII